MVRTLLTNCLSFGNIISPTCPSIPCSWTAFRKGPLICIRVNICKDISWGLCSLSIISEVMKATVYGIQAAPLPFFCHAIRQESRSESQSVIGKVCHIVVMICKKSISQIPFKIWRCFSSTEKSEVMRVFCS